MFEKPPKVSAQSCRIRFGYFCPGPFCDRIHARNDLVRSFCLGARSTFGTSFRPRGIPSIPNLETRAFPPRGAKLAEIDLYSYTVRAETCHGGRGPNQTGKGVLQNSHNSCFQGGADDFCREPSQQVSLIDSFAVRGRERRQSPYVLLGARSVTIYVVACAAPRSTRDPNPKEANYSSMDPS